MGKENDIIRDLIIKAKEKAYKETSNEPEPELVKKNIDWPVKCTVGPGLEGAIACESKVGYVNGSKGWLIYRGYDIFDLAAYSTYEEVSYLLLHGKLPTKQELKDYKAVLKNFSYLPLTLRQMLSLSVEKWNTMAALRVGTSILRQIVTYRDKEMDTKFVKHLDVIGTDEDSIPMETQPMGEKRAIYEFTVSEERLIKENVVLDASTGLRACYRLIAGLPTIVAAISRLREGRLPIEPDPDLSFVGNFLYMMKGEKPTPVEERIMDIALILHADHGMNASTFASMVVASTLSDIYFSIESGISALNGPLHGGANERVLYTLEEIKSPDRVEEWFKKAQKEKRKIMGFGHRVYKAYDPRARILGPLAKFLCKDNNDVKELFKVAQKLEEVVVSTLGAKKKIFPNVDFYSGLVYRAMGIKPEMFTPIFAVSRVSGWTARIIEYLKHNRIFRPRAIYTGDFNKKLKRR